MESFESCTVSASSVSGAAKVESFESCTAAADRFEPWTAAASSVPEISKVVKVDACTASASSMLARRPRWSDFSGDEATPIPEPPSLASDRVPRVTDEHVVSHPVAGEVPEVGRQVLSRGKKKAIRKAAEAAAEAASEAHLHDLTARALDDLGKEKLKTLARLAGIPLKQAGKRLSADDLRQEVMHVYFSQPGALAALQQVMISHD